VAKPAIVSFVGRIARELEKARKGELVDEDDIRALGKVEAKRVHKKLRKTIEGLEQLDKNVIDEYDI
jgi:hypothetical protein